MGLFSSKKKTYVNTTVQPIFDEAQIPNSIKVGVIKGIINEGSIVDYMLEETVHSIGGRADSGYNWAKKNYEFGLPTSTLTASANGRTVVMTTLADLEDSPVTADYYRYGPLNSIHYGFQHLCDDYGYNPATNELTVLSAQVGAKVYLSNMVATYKRSTFDEAVEHDDLGAFEQWGPSPTSGYTPANPMNTLQGFGQYAAQTVYQVSETATEDYITVSYQFEQAGALVDRTLVLSMAGINLDDDYHMARYSIKTGQIKFFTYKDNAGDFPEIDAAQDIKYDDLGTYYPWIYARYNGNNMASEAMENTKGYKDTMKYCKYLGLDFLALSEGIEADPNVDDVEQAIVMFGVNPGATTQCELEYLFEYLSLMYLNGAAEQNNSASLLDSFNDYARSPDVAQVIQDKMFAMGLIHSGIAKRRAVGNIAKVGSFTGELVAETTEVEYDDVSSDHGTRRSTQTVTTYSWRYRKQVNSNTYEEVQVYNPSMVYQIAGKKGHTAGVSDKELLIPVDRAVVRNMSFRVREELLTRAMYLVVNTKVVVKSPWYSASWFKIVLIVIVIVITVLTWGTGSGPAAALAAAASAGAAALAIAIIQMVVISLAISYATKLFVKAVGPEIGLIAAIAAIAYGGYSSYNAVTASQATWATTMVSIGSNLATASSNQYQDQIATIQDDMNDFLNWANGQFDTLKQKAEQLSLSSADSYLGLDFVKYEPLIVFGEAPQDLYTRTVHSGNIGAVSFDMVGLYVDNALTLPTLRQSEGDFKDGWIA